MLPPYSHHRAVAPRVPAYIRRDFDDLPLNIRPPRREYLRRWRLPVWPGFRLAITLEKYQPAGEGHV